MKFKTRVPFEETYRKLVQKFQQLPSGDEEYSPSLEEIDTIYISLRHSVCLHYLVWLQTKSTPDMEKFIEVGIRWRKQNRSIVASRTFLMKQAALFKKRLKQAKARERQAVGGVKGTHTQLENKIGVHSDDYPTELHQENGRKGQAKQMAAGRPPHTKYWLVVDRYGREFYIFNMNEFCRKHGLISGHMYEVAKGVREHHRGYWCQKLDKDDYENKKSKLRVRATINPPEANQ